jgi:hypothetical protein
MVSLIIFLPLLCLPMPSPESYPAHLGVTFSRFKNRASSGQQYLTGLPVSQRVSAATDLRRQRVVRPATAERA